MRLSSQHRGVSQGGQARGYRDAGFGSEVLPVVEQYTGSHWTVTQDARVGESVNTVVHEENACR